MSKKTNMTISFNDAQMDLFDFVLTNLNHGVYNRTSYLLNTVRQEVREFLGLPHDVSLSDDQILILAINQNESNIKNVVGEKNYNVLIEKKGDE